MRHQLIKQPNGLLCCWSTVTDSIEGFDFRPEDYIKREAFDMAVWTYQTLLKIDAGNPAHPQFTKSWDKVAHPAPCNCGQCHNCAGFPPCDCGDYLACEDAENKETSTGETAKWIANIEKGLRAGGKPMPKFKPLSLRPAPIADDVIGVYRNNFLVGFVCKYSFSDGWRWETATERYRCDHGEGLSLLAALRDVLTIARKPSNWA